jgi:hypothetical protein
MSANVVLRSSLIGGARNPRDRMKKPFVVARPMIGRFPDIDRSPSAHLSFETAGGRLAFGNT